MVFGHVGVARLNRVSSKKGVGILGYRVSCVTALMGPPNSGHACRRTTCWSCWTSPRQELLNTHEKVPNLKPALDLPNYS